MSEAAQVIFESATVVRAHGGIQEVFVPAGVAVVMIKEGAREIYCKVRHYATAHAMVIVYVEEGASEHAIKCGLVLAAQAFAKEMAAL